MTTFTTTGNTFKKIKRGEADFLMTDGIKLVPRATIEISQCCPDNYKSLINECVEHGWLRPVAYMKESEYIWEKLGD
jgi:flavoprotein